MFKNRYQARRVADTDERGCFICHRPTTSVLANEIPSADFFFVCRTHLDDPGFAKLDPQIAQQQKEIQELEAQKRRLRAEWNAKQKSEEANDKTNETNPKEVPSGTEITTPDGDSGGNPDIKADVKTPAPDSLQTQTVRPALPKIYELNRNIYNLRITAKRRQAQERRTRELLANPASFPKVPTNKID